MAASHVIHPAAIEVDPTFTHGDSDYESNLSEYSTESLSSSIRNYRYEHGRRYHAYKDGIDKYLVPNDEKEQERLDIFHHIYLLMLDGKLQLAPVEPNIQRILDVGTGTGIWAIDAAETYPSAEVIGTDISPIQPSWVPPNVSFQVDDAELEWTFGDNSFDLIHIRHLNGAIKDWQKLIKQAYRCLKPGGYIDVAEYEANLFSDDDSIPEGCSLAYYYELIDKAAEKNGRSFRIAPNLDPLLKKAGFTGIHHEIFKTPIGTWPVVRKQKEMGAYANLAIESAFEAFGVAPMTLILGMPIEEVESLIKNALKEARNRQIHSYANQHLYYGQKPLEPLDR